MSSRVPIRYLGWMARDAAIRPGLAVVVFAALFAFIATRVPGSLTAITVREFLIRTVAQTDWLVVLIATTGLVSGDRASGYYRSLFSHPVHPAAYYLLRWLVAGAVAALFVPLVGLGLLTVSGIFPYSGALLVRFLLKYLLLGGVTFMFSTVLRADWAFAFTLSLVESILYGLEKAGAPISAFTKSLLHVMPPFHIGSAGFFGSPGYPTGAELTHALLYGAGLVGAAIAVLLLRPLGTGSRT